MIMLSIGALTSCSKENNVKPNLATTALKTSKFLADKSDVGTADLADKSDVGTADGDKSDVGTADSGK